MFLTRLTIRPESLQRRHWPQGLPHHDLYAQHRFVWNLFQEDDERRFLFRAPPSEDRPWLLLSDREPGLDPRVEHQSKLFQPRLVAGQRLGFQVRINPTRSCKIDGQRGRREDVVQHARRRDPGADPATVVLAWLEEQGRDPVRPETSLGFGDVALASFERRLLPLRKPGGKAVKLAIYDLEGALRVDDPDRFSAMLRDGIGRSRAFGCGLMLVRPLS